MWVSDDDGDTSRFARGPANRLGTNLDTYFSMDCLFTRLPSSALIRTRLWLQRHSPRYRVSLLTPFEAAKSPLDWSLGTHGIHITFHDPSTRGRRYSATYLPEVAPAQGWTKEKTVISLIRKAGYRGKVSPGDALWTSIQTKRYRSEKCQVEWEEYVRWKQDVKARHSKRRDGAGSVQGKGRKQGRGIELDEEDVEADDRRMVTQEA